LAADAAVATVLSDAPATVAHARGHRSALGWLWSGALLLILTFLVIYPVAMLLLGALTNTNPVVDGFGVFNISLANFVTVLANPNVHLALANSLIACGGGTALAVVIGLTFSWVVVRTNTPCKGFIAAASMLPLFVPPWLQPSPGRSSPPRARGCSTPCWRASASNGASTSTRWAG
jgi:iron(III) transport system permease protein